MSYNRSVAKTKTVHRIDRQHEIRIPSLEAWHVNRAPFTPRCRHCGSKITARDLRCQACWRPL